MDFLVNNFDLKFEIKTNDLEVNQLIDINDAQNVGTECVETDSPGKGYEYQVKNVFTFEE